MARPSALITFLTSLTLNAQTTHELHVVDDEFIPASLNIVLGDAVHIVFDDTAHTFTQVDQLTWMNNGVTPLPGGYNFGVGTPNPGSEFTITPDSVYVIFYVCQFHMDSLTEMKGTIDVAPASGVADGMDALEWWMAPVDDGVMIHTEAPSALELALYHPTGALCRTLRFDAPGHLDLRDLSAGTYVVEIKERSTGAWGRQRLVLVR